MGLSWSETLVVDFSVDDFHQLETSPIVGATPFGNVEDNYSSKEEIDQVAQQFLTRAQAPNTDLIVKHQIWRCPKTSKIRRSIKILETEEQDTMIRNISSGTGTALVINIYENTRSGTLYYKGVLTAHVSFPVD